MILAARNSPLFLICVCILLVSRIQSQQILTCDTTCETSWLEAFNKLRSQQLACPALPPLTWNAALASYATARVMLSCKSNTLLAASLAERTNVSGYALLGETVLASSSQSSPSLHISSWADPQRWFSFGSAPPCNAPPSSSCDSYTTMVHNASTHVGCASCVSSTGLFFYTCYFGPFTTAAATEPYLHCSQQTPQLATATPTASYSTTVYEHYDFVSSSTIGLAIAVPLGLIGCWTALAVAAAVVTYHCWEVKAPQEEDDAEADALHLEDVPMETVGLTDAAGVGYPNVPQHEPSAPSAEHNASAPPGSPSLQGDGRNYSAGPLEAAAARSSLHHDLLVGHDLFGDANVMGKDCTTSHVDVFTPDLQVPSPTS